MKFGERLRQIRKEKDLSQETFAAILGTSKQVISRYETGLRTPKISIANEYAERLGVPLDYLLGEDTQAGDSVFSINNILPIETRRIPLLGDIACGQPIYAEEQFEHYVECGADIRADFALRCKGDSMINARIMDGDIVFIRKQPEVNNREIAAVLIKKLKRDTERLDAGNMKELIREYIVKIEITDNDTYIYAIGNLSNAGSPGAAHAVFKFIYNRKKKTPHKGASY